MREERGDRDEVGEGGEGDSFWFVSICYKLYTIKYNDYNHYCNAGLPGLKYNCNKGMRHRQGSEREEKRWER